MLGATSSSDVWQSFEPSRPGTTVHHRLYHYLPPSPPPGNAMPPSPLPPPPSYPYHLNAFLAKFGSTKLAR